MPKSDIKPVLQIKREFSFLSVMCRSPVRMVSGGLILLFLTQDVYSFFGAMGALLFVAFVFLGAFFTPFFFTFMDYRLVTYDFFTDHASWYETFYLKERVKLPYTTFSEVIVTQKFFQQGTQSADIILRSKTRSGQTFDTIIFDVSGAQTLKKKIESIVAKYTSNAYTSNKSASS